MDNGYAMSLGLAFSIDDEMKHIMVSSGWDPSMSQGTDDWTLPIPATFIVGTDGIVHARFIDPDIRTRMAKAVAGSQRANSGTRPSALSLRIIVPPPLDARAQPALN